MWLSPCHHYLVAIVFSPLPCHHCPVTIALSPLPCYLSPSQLHDVAARRGMGPLHHVVLLINRTKDWYAVTCLRHGLMAANTVFDGVTRVLPLLL